MLTRIDRTRRPSPEDEPPLEQSPRVRAALREVILAEIAIEEAEDCLRLEELAADWDITPEVAAQIAGETKRPGQTWGERVTELWFNGGEE